MVVAIAILGLALGALYQAASGATRNVRVDERYAYAVELARSLLADSAVVPANGEQRRGETAGGFVWRVDAQPLPRSRDSRPAAGPAAGNRGGRELDGWRPPPRGGAQLHRRGRTPESGPALVPAASSSRTVPPAIPAATHGSGSAARSRGFTLVEVMVSLTILTLVMLATVTGLRTLGNTQVAIERLTGRVDEMRSVSSFLRDTLNSAVTGSDSGGLTLGGGRGERTIFEVGPNALMWKAVVLFGEDFGGSYVVRVAAERARAGAALAGAEPPRRAEGLE